MGYTQALLGKLSHSSLRHKPRDRVCWESESAHESPRDFCHFVGNGCRAWGRGAAGGLSGLVTLPGQTALPLGQTSPLVRGKEFWKETRTRKRGGARYPADPLRTYEISGLLGSFFWSLKLHASQGSLVLSTSHGDRTQFSPTYKGPQGTEP